MNDDVDKLLELIRADPSDEGTRHHLIAVLLARGDGDSMQAASLQLATLLARRSLTA